MFSASSSSSTLLILIVQLIASCGMMGVIWFVQLITYPQFEAMNETAFTEYHANYSRRVTWIVAPLMLVELGTAFLIAIRFWQTQDFVLAIVGLLLVLALWGLTAFVQVPQHSRLSYGYSIETIRELVHGNWARTILWSIKVVITSMLLVRYLSRSFSVIP
ncbi:MAG: hypothetical protein AAF357_02305 [Verrucomicrobiota bacterium]